MTTSSSFYTNAPETPITAMVIADTLRQAAEEKVGMTLFQVKPYDPSIGALYKITVERVEA